jgi:DNA-binding Lrp family transcriptional regulator
LLHKAFIFLNAEVGAEDELVQELMEIKNITGVFNLYGVYDIAVKIEAETMEELKMVVASKIRKLSNIRSTLTLIAAEDNKIFLTSHNNKR